MEMRRLRHERGWSQEDVAQRMATAGFTSWHQTTVGKTEAAQRPLRLNEAIALTELFGVPLHQLLAPLLIGVADLDDELRLAEQRRDEALREVGTTTAEQAEMRDALAFAENLHRRAVQALEAAEARLAALRKLRDAMRSQDGEAERATHVGWGPVIRRARTPDHGTRDQEGAR